MLTPFAFILFSCSNNRLDVDLTNDLPTIDFFYVDEALNNKNQTEIEKIHKRFSDELDELYLYEWSQNFRGPLNDSAEKMIYEFYNADYIKDLESAKKTATEKAKSKEPEIKKAFQYLSFHFSELKIPKQVIYMNKLFSTVKCSDHAISIGLESYISSDNEVIQSIPPDQLYGWQKERMNISFLERDIIFNWVQVHLFDEIDQNLAPHIVQAGKILYVVNAAFPNQPTSFILRYDEESMEWANENEQLTWDYLVKDQLLFKNNRRDKANFLNAGPTTVGLPDESPDRMGQFLGYKMVKGYMEKHKDVSLQDLIQVDYNTILQAYEIQ